MRLFFFVLYAFLGWMWESTYVSLHARRWVNRGSRCVPLLPIYGVGAVLILWVTHPFGSSILGTFLSGMVVATALEFLTGWVLDHWFHRRLWDYSHMPWNLDGYVALLPSLCWGGFSVALVYLIHPMVLAALPHLPSVVLSGLSGAGLLLLLLSRIPLPCPAQSPHRTCSFLPRCGKIKA